MRTSKVYNPQTSGPYEEIQEIRKHLRPKGVPVRELSHFFGKIKVDKNAYEMNNAMQAKLWKPVCQRVRSVISRAGFIHSHRREQTPGHKKRSTGNRLAQHCEVLGPYYCKDCIKTAQRYKHNYAISERFPDVIVNERHLCQGPKELPLSLISSSLPAFTDDVANINNLEHGVPAYMTRTELQNRVMARQRSRLSAILKTQSTPDLHKSFTKQKKRTRFLD